MIYNSFTFDTATIFSCSGGTGLSVTNDGAKSVSVNAFGFNGQIPGFCKNIYPDIKILDIEN